MTLTPDQLAAIEADPRIGEPAKRRARAEVRRGEMVTDADKCHNHPTAEVRITLPLPARALSPNARQHWAAKAKAVKQARATAKMAAIRATRGKPPRWERAEVRTTFYWPDRRRRDADNAISSCKALLDGIADAGIVLDDVGFILHPPAMTKDALNPRVEVVVERAA